MADVGEGMEYCSSTQCDETNFWKYSTVYECGYASGLTNTYLNGLVLMFCPLVNENDIGQISFDKIDNIKFKFVKGSTFYEWIKSSNNTIDGLTCNSPSSFVYYNNESTVYMGNKLLINGETYVL